MTLHTLSSWRATLHIESMLMMSLLLSRSRFFQHSRTRFVKDRVHVVWSPCSLIIFWTFGVWDILKQLFLLKKGLISQAFPGKLIEKPPEEVGLFTKNYRIRCGICICSVGICEAGCRFFSSTSLGDGGEG